jgi:hypothetical protein
MGSIRVVPSTSDEDIGPIASFCNLAELSVQQLYDFWLNRPLSTDDEKIWREGEKEREGIITELERCYHAALRAASKVYSGQIAEQRLYELLNKSSHFLRLSVPRGFGHKIGGIDAVNLEQANGYQPFQLELLKRSDLSEQDRNHINANAAGWLHQLKTIREGSARDIWLKKGQIETALKDCRSLASACGENPFHVSASEEPKETTPSQQPELYPRDSKHFLFLRALHRLKAFEKLKAISARRMAREIDGREGTAGNYVRTRGDLKKAALIDTTEGGGGGSYLTQKGRSYIEEFIKSNKSSTSN